jgi:hypothetical protein
MRNKKITFNFNIKGSRYKNYFSVSSQLVRKNLRNLHNKGDICSLRLSGRCKKSRNLVS